MRDKRPHIAVIGAGIIGACLAVRLAEQGARVTLLDQGRPGRATSRLSFAWLNANEKLPRSYHDLNAAGMLAWAKTARWLDGDTWYRPVGNLCWAGDTGRRMVLRERVRRLREWRYPARTVSVREAADLEPAARVPPEVGEAAWFPSEGYLLTEPLVGRLVARAGAHGARVLLDGHGRVAGIALDEQGAGRLRTAAGDVLRVDAAVCCAGRWTPQVAALAGAAVPLAPLRGATGPAVVVRVRPEGGSLPRCVLHTSRVNIRPHTDGLMHLEALDAAAAPDAPEPAVREAAQALLARAGQVVPALGNARLVEYHVCVRPIPRDGKPVVGRPPGSGLYVVVTHSGVTLAAHLAELAAQELTSGGELPQLSAYRPGRFPDTAAL